MGKIHRARSATCLICNKQFYAVKDFNTLKGCRKQKYCSKICWARRNPPTIKKCLYCTSKFSTYGKERKTKVYCKQECRDTDYRVRFKGPKSHRWEGGKTEKMQIIKSSARYKEWRTAVFKRDGYRCVFCGVKGIYLEADHIKPKHKYPKLMFRISNGRTLCRSCHRKTPTFARKMP